MFVAIATIIVGSDSDGHYLGHFFFHDIFLGVDKMIFPQFCYGINQRKTLAYLDFSNFAIFNPTFCTLYCFVAENLSKVVQWGFVLQGRHILAHYTRPAYQVTTRSLWELYAVPLWCSNVATLLRSLSSGYCNLFCCSVCNKSFGKSLLGITVCRCRNNTWHLSQRPKIFFV